MWRLLEEKEKYKEGDQYFSGMGEWHDVPDTWFGMVHTHEQDNTIGRMKLPVRREIEPVCLDCRKEYPKCKIRRRCKVIQCDDILPFNTEEEPHVKSKKLA